MLAGLARQLGGRLLVGVLYPIGLTLLVPAVLLHLIPEGLVALPPAAPPLLVGIALAMLLASLLACRAYAGSLARALLVLGRLAFVPGLLGLVLSIFGREMALGHLARTWPRFADVRPAVELYLDHAVPRMRLLTLGFFALGAGLLLLGDRLRRRRPA